jgi:hypothetical protein
MADGFCSNKKEKLVVSTSYQSLAFSLDQMAPALLIQGMSQTLGGVTWLNRLSGRSLYR